MKNVYSRGGAAYALPAGSLDGGRMVQGAYGKQVGNGTCRKMAAFDFVTTGQSRGCGECVNQRLRQLGWPW